MQNLETESLRPRLKSFETETTPETFKTETRKHGSRDTSRDRDQVSRLHHWYFHLQLFLPNSALEQISSQEIKFPCLVSQMAPVWEPLPSTIVDLFAELSGAKLSVFPFDFPLQCHVNYEKEDLFLVLKYCSY